MATADSDHASRLWHVFFAEFFSTVLASLADICTEASSTAPSRHATAPKRRVAVSASVELQGTVLTVMKVNNQNKNTLMVNCKHFSLWTHQWVYSALFLLSIGYGAAAHADAPDPTDWLQLSGFGTLGAAYNNNSDHIFQRDLTQPDTFDGHWSYKTDSLLGVQLDATLSPSFTATTQLVLKDRTGDTATQSLEWAFFRYRPNHQWMARAGRLGLDIYLLSDYRNVSFAYLWQRPPPEFYGALVVTNLDGADISYSANWLDGRLRVKVFAGKSNPKVAYSQHDQLELDFLPIFGANLAFESQHWRAQAGFGQVRFHSEVAVAQQLLDALHNPALGPAWPQAASIADTLAVDGKYLRFYSAGIAYDNNQWLIQSELGHLDSQWAALRSLLSAYLSVGRRIDNLTPYVVFGVVKPTGDTVEVPAPAFAGDPAIDALYAGVQSYANGFQFDQQTLSLGARWDLRQNVAVKLQWDHSWVKAKGGSLWLSKGPDEGFLHDDSVDLFSASVNFLFKP